MTAPDFHESDDESAESISFTVSSCAFSDVDLCDFSDDDNGDKFKTEPGTALGVGQRIDAPGKNESTGSVSIKFDLDDDECIGVSEVRCCVFCCNTLYFRAHLQHIHEFDFVVLVVLAVSKRLCCALHRNSSELGRSRSVYEAFGVQFVLSFLG